MLLVPTKAAVAFSDKVSVGVWFDPEAEVPVPFTVHWLFPRVPPDPAGWRRACSAIL